MDEILDVGGNQIASLAMVEDENSSQIIPRRNEGYWLSLVSLSYIQKLIAEFIGTYFLIFGGCTAIVVHVNMEKVVTLPGIAMVWGLIVMVMIYCVGHISGAHFNPAVTIAFASSNKFPWKQVPGYILVQVVASIVASETVGLIFNGKQGQILTLPSGSNMESLVLEFITTFFLMFVISAIATTDKAIKEVAGVAVGSTVSIDILFAGPISGASMNPARSLGPAIIANHYQGLWIYIVGPILGAVAGAWAYEIVRLRNKPSRKISTNKREIKRSISTQQSVVRLTINEGDEVSSCKCGEGWTCFITKTEPAKAGKAYYTCGGGIFSSVMMLAAAAEISTTEGTVFCKCDEGWSCTISKIDESSFECGEGCVCVIDETNTMKIAFRDRWISRREDL